MPDLDGRVAVVSGGSRRLGRATSQALAADGCRIVVNFAHSGGTGRGHAGRIINIGLDAAWATELGADDITVNLVAPGFVPVERHAEVTSSERAAYVADVPLGRIGEPRTWRGSCASSHQTMRPS